MEKNPKPFVLADNVQALVPNLDECIGIALQNADGAQVKAISLPSGSWVIIREQNGDDDGILSNPSLQKDASSINLFVAGIIVYSPKSTTPTGLLTLEDVLDMPIRDKYITMIKSRIFSMGNTLEFKYAWKDAEGVSDNYEEDLDRYIWDYTVAFPGESSDENYDVERVAPYKIIPTDGFIYGTTDGKVYPTSFDPTKVTPGLRAIRMKLLNGHSEKVLLGMGENGQNINTKLLARGLELYVAGSWIPVVSFKVFKSPEMAAIRKIVREYDMEFDGNTIIENVRTNDAIQIPLMSIPTFFFPLGT